MNAPNTFLFALMSLMTLVSSLRSVSVGRFQSLCYVQEDEKDFNDCIEFLSYFEKNSSLVGLNFGLCIYVSMYVCFFLCIGLCHTNQIEATILPWKVIHQ